MQIVSRLSRKAKRIHECRGIWPNNSRGKQREMVTVKQSREHAALGSRQERLVVLGPGLNHRKHHVENSRLKTRQQDRLHVSILHAAIATDTHFQISLGFLVLDLKQG